MSEGIQDIEGRAALSAAARELISAVSLELRIASRCLEGAIYRDRDLIDALKAQLLAQRRLRVRLLVAEPDQALREAEPLLELLRRLSSQVDIHTPHAADLAFEHEWLIADERGFVRRDRPDNLISRYAAAEALAARALAREFDAAWDRSRPASELRRLGI